MAGPSRDDAPDGDGDLDDAAVDARWAELTAALGELRMPDGPDEPQPATDRAAPPRRPHLRPPAPPGPRDYEPAAPADDGADPAGGADGFAAPEPEPLEHADPALTLGWVATVGPVVVGLLLAIFWSPVPDLVLGVLGVTLVAGVALLLWRMPADRGDRGPEDGAVV